MNTKKQATESHRKNTEKDISVKFCEILWQKIFSKFASIRGFTSIF